VRSLIESTPEATRIELRTGGSDANPYWLVASALAAVIAGLRAGSRPPEPAGGNLYDSGAQLPESLGVAVALAEQDDTIAEILGRESVHDFAAIARSEWNSYTRQVSDWERRRYLTTS
jgi:glutamine synthetase